MSTLLQEKSAVDETSQVDSVPEVLDALEGVIRDRHQQYPDLTNDTVADIRSKLGHHTDLAEFISAAQNEALGDDLRTVAAQLPFRTRSKAILLNAEKARYS